MYNTVDHEHSSRLLRSMPPKKPRETYHNRIPTRPRIVSPIIGFTVILIASATLNPSPNKAPLSDRISVIVNSFSPEGLELFPPTQLLVPRESTALICFLVVLR
ncbi:uncharacterized protein K460DRAFT_189683 [Cucurbitaria berberidis CBS 394.84]|uniref:Uncharacterized protein n=1 Tax=Cucurbitaria berberidis CBS 394.84 TaxID=1168544 RepID=A0A9P4GB94_9PLEO|nr:uncharacterized protein K460DRAFT_189683 [Cucurbitaria berberidis CBS 394.84]KAF1842638.1 hypothetical protein K460DRAFT_189683 [Cucurbitaria berberidis CBS 394.84]